MSKLQSRRKLIISRATRGWASPIPHPRVLLIRYRSGDPSSEQLFPDQMPVPRNPWDYDAADRIQTWRGAYGAGPPLHMIHNGLGATGVIGSGSPADPCSVGPSATANFDCDVALNTGNGRGARSRKKTRRSEAPLLRRVGLIAALLVPALAPLPASAAKADAILRGIVSTEQAPVGAGTILLYDGANLVQTGPYQSFYNGTFAVNLNRAAARALSAGVLRVKVAVDQTTTLMVDLGAFDPARQVIFINPVTTITAAYRNLRPATAVAKAGGSVAAALAVSSPRATACQTVTGFNGPMLLTVGAGGFDAYVQSIAQQIADGQTPSLRGNLGVPQDFRDFFLETVSEIFGEALGGFPGAKPLAGWILGGIFTGGEQGVPPEELQQIEKELGDISGQLNQVLAGISQLSAQIYNLEQALAASQALTNYQNDAATTQTWINDLCHMNQELIALAKSDPTKPGTQQFATNLQAQIQANAGNDLANMWSVLEGNGGTGTRSLINEWANAVGTNLGAPRFANVSYLASAVPNLQYYQGAMLVGYNLQIELAHAFELQGSSTLASELITQANSDFEQNEDILMKLVGQNHPIGSGPTGLYAAVLPPFFAAAMPPGGATSPNVYNADPTNAYNWSIDTSSGLLWMRSRSCDGSTFSNCNFAMYNQASGLPSGAELAQPYISKINASLNDSYPDELLALTAPSRAQWISLLSGLPKSQGAYAINYLASIYFFGAPGKNGVPLANYYHFWTSDIGSEAAGPQLFPAWDNWSVDTRYPPLNGASTFTCCKALTDNLELVSAAPMTDPYHFLYRSHQDYFSRNIFVSGPALGVARADATVTPLLNGKVLIAGGWGPQLTALNSTELYDPATNTFAAGPAMKTARSYAMATLLPNGKVLIAGGQTVYNDGASNPGVASTELYDPTTNTIVAGPTMNGSRRTATATLLPDGKVLIAGGSPQHSVDLYDAYANTFAPAAFQPALHYDDYYATATLLPNGKVLIAGGADAKLGRTSNTELYDPATNTLAAGPTMSAGREAATATLLPNGKVLIAGGIGDAPLNSTDLYDPATNTFAAGPAMNASRFEAASTSLPNGKVLIAGGVGPNLTVLNSTELYDPATNTFGPSNPMDAARFDEAIVVLPDSQVLIAGGFGTGSYPDPIPLSATDLYTE
jgi:hypothetical protein